VVPVAQVVGDLLPLAVVVAVSPVPIIAVILMLLTPRAGGTGSGFLAGWIVGIAGVTTVFLVLAGNADLGSSASATAAAWVQLVLGGGLLALALRQRRARPGAADEPGLPGWLAAIDRITPVRAGALGLLLSAANPKVLLVCVAAGLAIAGGGSSIAQGIWSVAVFTVIAVSTVAVPVLGYAVGGRHMAGPLTSLRGWLTAHSRVAATTLLLVIGVVLVGQGLVGLV
jgi:threonine/homoserine/homoserine lactone efflux protein